jgi:hypothetical protein
MGACPNSKMLSQTTIAEVPSDVNCGVFLSPSSVKRREGAATWPIPRLDPEVRPNVDSPSRKNFDDAHNLKNIHEIFLPVPAKGTAADPSFLRHQPSSDDVQLCEETRGLSDQVRLWNNRCVFGKTSKVEQVHDDDGQPEFMSVIKDDLEKDGDPNLEDENSTTERLTERKLAYTISTYSMPGHCRNIMVDAFADPTRQRALEELAEDSEDGAIARALRVHLGDQTASSFGSCVSDLNIDQFKTLFGSWDDVEKEMVDSILAREDVRAMINAGEVNSCAPINPAEVVMAMEHRIWRTDFTASSRGSRVKLLHRDYNPFGEHYEQNHRFFQTSEIDLDLPNGYFQDFFDPDHDYFQAGKKRNALMLTLALPLHAQNIDQTKTGTRFKERESNRVHTMPSIGGYGVFFRTGGDAPNEKYVRSSNTVKFDFDVPFHAGPAELIPQGHGDSKRFFIQTKTMVMRKTWKNSPHSAMRKNSEDGHSVGGDTSASADDEVSIFSCSEQDVSIDNEGDVSLD